jgi:hypothetical protein
VYAVRGRSQYLPFADATALAVYDAFERAVYQTVESAWRR